MRGFPKNIKGRYNIMEYKYEMHIHTKEGSSDATMTGRQAVLHYKKLGYSGICITDHFTGSITRNPADLWDVQMDTFCKGYEEAAREAVGTDVSVFFGLEFSDRGNDFLFFGLDKQWLKNNPDILDIPLKELLTRVRRDGGFVVHAHPFLQWDWIEMIRLLPGHVDAVEVVNMGIKPEENARAEWYAGSFNLKKTGGSDIHHDSVTVHSGIITKTRATDIKNLTDMIRAGITKVIRPN